MPVALTKGLNQKCCDCGIALYSQEIAYEITGTYIDYIEHVPGQITVLLCSGCRERLLHNLHADQGDAILKRKELEREGAKHTIAQIEAFSEEDLSDIDFRTPDNTGVGM
jgi:hypothetical protein